MVKSPNDLNTVKMWWPETTVVDARAYVDAFALCMMPNQAFPVHVQPTTISVRPLRPDQTMSACERGASAQLGVGPARSRS